MINLKSYRPIHSWIARASLVLALAAPIALSPEATAKPEKRGGPKVGAKDRYFKRIATFPVFLNGAGDDLDAETVSEIIDATRDGKTLVYTDAATESLGFVDISNPYSPQPLGALPLAGEPTSVKTLGKYALVCINTSADFVNTSGELVIVNIASQSIVESIALGGQPDAIAISPNNQYAAIAIENERDEDLGDGEPPQAPSGFLAIVDLKGPPSKWTRRDVALDGVPSLFPNDPEPEFVDINKDNVAAISLQENNHIILVDLVSGTVIDDFSAGAANLTGIDTIEDDIINQVDSIDSLSREPDALAWIGADRIVTADEGDLFGGSRGFTIFDAATGNVLFTSGNNDDQLMAMIGHYPEDRSENKGNEPEAVTVADYAGETHVFVGSERSSIVSVYRLPKGSNTPEFVQVLAGGFGPEGLLAIPQRGLFVTASEEDARDDKFRAVVTLYAKGASEPTYPTVASLDRQDGSPTPWGALSALAADPYDTGQAWTVYDSFYKKSRIFSMDTKGAPALIDDEIVLTDANDALADAIADANGKGYADILASDLINADGTVNLDPEGLTRRADGGFWLASEGSGTIGDPGRPIESQNWLLKVNDTGEIEEVVSLPDSTNAIQLRFGFEGVASVGSGDDEVLYVCFQRAWNSEGFARIGRYETATGDWTFFAYSLETPTSPNGGWVGLSEIVAISDTEFLVVERDNQAGLDATIKKIYGFSIAGLTPLPDADAPNFPLVSKTEIRDLIPDLLSDNGLVIEKVEGLAILANGDALIVTDNDGVDDSSGETQLINIGEL